MQDTSKKPLRKDQLLQALRIGGVSSNEYVQRIRARGVDFEMTPAIERELRAAGASSAMIEAIRANRYKPAPRPTPTPKPTPWPIQYSGRIIRSVEAPTPKPTPVPTPTPRPTVPQIEMVLIPAGTFMMGSPDSETSRNNDEEPQHRVSVPQFYMGKYEVTQAQWRAVMGGLPPGMSGTDSKFIGDNLPVVRVSWNESVEFCLKLSQMSGREYRLPTEAEWEYAARAGTTTPFAFGSSLSAEQANFNGNYPYGGAAKGVYREQTTAVGSFSPNGFGLYDMHGNVYEWCQDWYHENYNGAPTDGSAWESGGKQEFRVVRGGSWLSDASDCRSANRGYVAPGSRNNNVGLRVVAVART